MSATDASLPEVVYVRRSVFEEGEPVLTTSASLAQEWARLDYAVFKYRSEALAQQAPAVAGLEAVGWQVRHLCPEEGPSIWRHCDDGDAAFLEKRSDYELRRVYVPAAQQAPVDTDVRRILLDVVPGPDGMGEEVFAQSVDDVVAKLTELGEKAEELESLKAAQQAPAAEPVDDFGRPIVYDTNAIDDVTHALTGDEGEDDSVTVLQRMATYVQHVWPGKTALQVLMEYEAATAPQPLQAPAAEPVAPESALESMRKILFSGRVVDTFMLYDLYAAAIAAAPQPPQAQPLTLSARIAELIAEHGTLRAVSRALGISFSYLSRLEHGEKDCPSADVLERLGLRQVVVYERAHGIKGAA